VVAGHLLKRIRNALGLSQEDLAEKLGIGRNTLHAWESGRRPLTNVRAGDLLRLQQSLRGLGGEANLVGKFDLALPAHHFLQEAINAPPAGVDVVTHPLATLVIQRNFADWLSWPLTGRAPSGLPAASGRRGPERLAPVLPAGSRKRFFQHLREVADQASARGVASEASSVLLRRQAYYLASWDTTDDGRSWLRAMERREGRRPFPVAAWSPQWAAARSLAIACARQGDPEPLRRFIRSAMPSEKLEIANLNYWAYWVGEIQETQHDDSFMAGPLGAWGGTGLLSRLLEKLVVGEPTLELYIHSVWSLIRARPWILEASPRSANELRGRVEAVAAAEGLPPEVERELDAIQYATALGR
jgi:transcriptional regulator with XRE-family HTH domain